MKMGNGETLLVIEAKTFRVLKKYVEKQSSNFLASDVMRMKYATDSDILCTIKKYRDYYGIEQFPFALLVSIESQSSGGERDLVCKDFLGNFLVESGDWVTHDLTYIKVTDPRIAKPHDWRPLIFRKEAANFVSAVIVVETFVCEGGLRHTDFIVFHNPFLKGTRAEFPAELFANNENFFQCILEPKGNINRELLLINQCRPKWLYGRVPADVEHILTTSSIAGIPYDF
jgi:hypothetical protein